MTPKQVVGYLEKNGIEWKDFASRLAITESAIYFWLSQGWIAHDRQCQIQLEMPESALRASWRDIPKEKRPQPERAA